MNASQQPDELPVNPPAASASHAAPPTAPPVDPARVAAPPAPALGYYQTPPAPEESRRKSPVLACILSIVPGLGQIYVGYYGLGFLHAIVVGALISLMVAEPPEELLAIVVLFFIFFTLYNIVDAGRRAALYNLAVAGVSGVKLPDQITMPRPGGSIFGGACLIAAGFILLLNTRFGFSLEWIQDWWPVAPMVFGGYLIARAVQERSQEN